jgi:hypothetical protein
MKQVTADIIGVSGAALMGVASWQVSHWLTATILGAVLLWIGIHWTVRAGDA